MGVYTKAFVVLLGGLLGGSVGFYFQSKEDRRLGELRKIKLEEMRRLNQESQASQDVAVSGEAEQDSTAK
ncbi:hypothetical protein LPJ73_009291 [Coemansia sp. RSA 2703]|nr:hypothetical protein LPJ73_009291 [Coemansia sp. RSA 2703]KAJ2372389.1 hypothetical protein IW150_004138 [Coemansia sp. RSA 2607]KAJ2384487.1 hypothetical protein GGI05_004991 [Coemansia sp. RSA 2603]